MNDTDLARKAEWRRWHRVQRRKAVIVWSGVLLIANMLLAEIIAIGYLAVHLML